MCHAAFSELHIEKIPEKQNFGKNQSICIRQGSPPSQLSTRQTLSRKNIYGMSPRLKRDKDKDKATEIDQASTARESGENEQREKLRRRTRGRRKRNRRSQNKKPDKRSRTRSKATAWHRLAECDRQASITLTNYILFRRFLQVSLQGVWGELRVFGDRPTQGLKSSQNLAHTTTKDRLSVPPPPSFLHTQPRPRNCCRFYGRSPPACARNSEHHGMPKNTRAGSPHR